MLKAIVFGLAAGAAIQAWRNYPPEGPSNVNTLFVVLLAGLACAYLAGRWTGRGRSSATATATATATAVAGATADARQTVNVAVFTPGHGPGAGIESPAFLVPNDETPWFSGPRTQLTTDDLDGQDVAELIEQAETESRP